MQIYAYDYRTRRVTRTEPGPVTTHIVFDGGTSIEEYTSTASNPTVEYIRGHDYGGGVGGLEYSIRSGLPSFNFYDSRGDVTTQTNSAGTVTFQTAYEAFGNETVTDGSTLDRQKASTKEQDPTGLLNEGFRYRDPSTGTFLTRDPLGFKAGPNMYTYVRQNPWTHFDPEGLDSVPNPPPPPPPKQSVNESSKHPSPIAPPSSPPPSSSPTPAASAQKTNPGIPGAVGVATSIGSQANQMGVNRAAYVAKVEGQEKPTTGVENPERSAIKEATRTNPNVGQIEKAMVESSRPGLGPLPGSGGTSNATNPTINTLGKVMRVAGGVAVGGALAVDAYQVAKSPNIARALMQKGFGLIGGLGGGIAGGFVGSSVPVVGTIALSVAGAAAGNMAGERVGAAVYDRFIGH